MEVTATRATVLALAKDLYATAPEYLWADTPDAAVLRHSGTNRKWYGLIMQVGRSKLKLPGEGAVDILNVKCDPTLLGSLRANPGYLPAYHMSKASWLSVLLDGSLPLADVEWLLTMSYRLTEKTPRKPVRRTQNAE